MRHKVGSTSGLRAERHAENQRTTAMSKPAQTNSSTDLLAKAMRQVFMEKVEGASLVEPERETPRSNEDTSEPGTEAPAAT